jgi:hypothetical protein
LLFHFILFAWRAALTTKGLRFPKLATKVLEYSYIFITAFSLLNIFVFAPHMSDYVTWLRGDDTYLANQIKRAADSYLKGECIEGSAKQTITQTIMNFFTNPNIYVTDEDCRKLQKIVEAPDVKQYILSAVAPDRAFLKGDDYIECDMDSAGNRCVIKETLGTLISPLVTELEIVHEYVNLGSHSTSAGNNRLTWFGMLLLPIGIALRFVKTSVELAEELRAARTPSSLSIG